MKSTLCKKFISSRRKFTRFTNAGILGKNSRLLYREFQTVKEPLLCNSITEVLF